jgi:hypothetical protein
MRKDKTQRAQRSAERFKGKKDIEEPQTLRGSVPSAFKKEGRQRSKERAIDFFTHSIHHRA